MDWVLDVSRHRCALLSVSSGQTLLRLVSARALFWIVRSLLLGLGNNNIVSPIAFLFRTPVINGSLMVHHCTLALKASRISLIQEILTDIMIQIVSGSFSVAFSIRWSQSWIIGFLLISGASTVIFVLVPLLLRLLVEICHRLCFFIFYYKIIR